MQVRTDRIRFGGKMRKLLSAVLVIALVLCAAGCNSEKKSDIKVGMVCIGDRNTAYDRNFLDAAERAADIFKERGKNVEWIYTFNHPDGTDVTEANENLVRKGCKAVFNNSYGQEPYMIDAAEKHEDVLFIAMTNERSWQDDLPNTVNAFPSVHEGRYAAGVAAGLKLNEQIELGNITEDEALIGYVGAFTIAEVISGYTAYFLGARSVCPSVRMIVEFTGSWADPTEEANITQDLINKGAVLVSQHTDATTPATTAQQSKVFHTGYNVDMSGEDIAPDASIISVSIDWTNYFVYVIDSLLEGKTVDQDYARHGMADGDVVLTPLNEKIAAPGTAQALDEVRNKLAKGELKVFDTSAFTVNGKEVTSAFAIDSNGDFVADTSEAIMDGEFLESWYQSAPSFSLRIDGITLLNEKYGG